MAQMLIPEEIIHKILNMRPPRPHTEELKTCIAAKKQHGKFSHFPLLFFVKHRYRWLSGAYRRSRSKSYSARRSKRWYFSIT